MTNFLTNKLQPGGSRRRIEACSRNNVDVMMNRFKFETVVCLVGCVLVGRREIGAFLVDRFIFETVVSLVGWVCSSWTVSNLKRGVVVSLVGWVCSSWTVSNLKRLYVFWGVCVCVVGFRGVGVFPVDHFNWNGGVFCGVFVCASWCASSTLGKCVFSSSTVSNLKRWRASWDVYVPCGP